MKTCMTVPSVLDQIEKALTEESALYPPMSSMAREYWSLARDRTEKLLRNHAADLIAVCKAAQRYRAVGLADPTSLDLPPAGADLDRALATLTRDSDA